MPISHPAPDSAAQRVPASALIPLGTLEQTLPGKAVLAITATAFIALCAHVPVPLPFTPIPLTLSDMAVILVGLFLAPSTAFAALILYLAEGAAGMPVFNPGGLGGVAQLVGPTGGFLFAYPLAALAASVAVRAGSRLASKFVAAAAAAFLGSVILMVLGVAWLGISHHLSPWLAIELGALPFLPGQVVKIVAAAGIFSALQRWQKA